MRRCRERTIGLLLVCVLAVARAASGQETINYASVAGRVVDATGAPVPGATVTARQIETNVPSTAVTDRDGRFRFSYLRVGTCELTVQMAGFAPATRRLTLTVGAAFDLSIVLSVGPVAESVTVRADAPALETARSQIAATVGQAEVQALPLNGRSFLDIALIVPGVAPTNVGGGTQLFAETSPVPGVGLSVGSQRNLSNNFTVDGLSANDDAAALSGISFGVDAIEQVQVVTSGGQAELGRALGGHINVATRSGTNVLRGESYLYVRDDRFNAANALFGAKLPMHQNQYGLSLGGPVVRNRSFYFANVEQRTLDQSGLVRIPAADASAINARLQAIGYRGPGVSTGIYENPVDTTHLLAKIDHHASPNDLVTLRYSLYDVHGERVRGAGGTSAPSASAGIDSRDQTIAAGNVWVLSGRTVLETRGQVARSRLDAPPSDPIGPAVGILGVAAFGTLSSSPTGRDNTTYQLVNNLSHRVGAHALRAGVDFLYNDLTIDFPRAARGSYSFSSLANFMAGVYNTSGFTQTFGDTIVTQTNPNVGVYVQDEWKARDRLTVNAGLRYDVQYLETIRRDRNNVSPRIGAVWSPGESRVLVRASAGRFYDRIPLRALANALLSAGNTTDPARLRQINVSLSPAQAGAPVFPAILTAVVPTSALVNFTRMDPDIQNAYSDQMSVEVERQLGSSGMFSAGYEHLRGRQLILQINRNVPACAVSGGNNGCRPVSAFANDNVYSSAGRSVYDGLHVSFVERLARWGTYRVSYAYSKSMNDLGEAFFSSPLDPTDLSKDWGRSDDDQRHRLTISGSIATSMAPAAGALDRLTHGFQVSWLVQYYSALPFNITTGVNTIQGTPARPMVNGAYIARNAGEGSAFSTTSLRISRSFAIHGRLRIDGLVEAFNLFNRRNDIARNTVFGTGAYPSSPSPTFGRVTVVGEPRSLQLGVRVRY